MKVLIVDDEQTARYGMRKVLSPKLDILEAANLAIATRVLTESCPEVVLLDLNLGEESGFDLFKTIERLASPPIVIVITAHGNERIAVEAMKRGAFHYLAKPFEIEELRILVRHAAEQIELRDEVRRLKEELETATGFGPIVGRSKAIRDVFSMIERVAETDVTVLIEGESGSGKELIAREIHARSNRRRKSLVAVNCAAIPENLIESELFGHEKGSFTGASQLRIGKFEQAQQGTIFLDEIGDMPLETQAKILRALEQKQIERVGGNTPIDVDVRIISATNRDLNELVVQGKFREDLYYRLEVVRIGVPPLRNRRDDIPLLVEHFSDQYSRKHGRQITGVSPEAMALLLNYPFPGNVRQLRNMIERTVVLVRGPVIEKTDLPDEVRFFEPALEGQVTLPNLDALLELDYRSARELFETQYLLSQLRKHANNISQTADSIGIHRQSLQQKIKDLGLRRFF